ncbi:NACHT, LRR and PYD domains-containing protein 3-like [Fundulus diaphanus]
MAGVIDLLESLEDLGDGEFKKFKWYLQQGEFLKTIPSIPKSQLEKSDRPDTVDLMVQTYSRQCVEVARRVLQRMKRNDLVERLSNAASQSAGQAVPVQTCRTRTPTCGGAENQAGEPAGEQQLCSAEPPPPQQPDEPVAAKSGAAEVLTDSSTNHRCSADSAEIRGGGEKEADSFIHPPNIPAIRRQPEDYKKSAPPGRPTTSEPAALQSILQNAFSSVTEGWLEKHRGEAFCFMDPELFITEERAQQEEPAPEPARPVTVSTMFQHLSRRGESSSTVVTKGGAGVGKSFLVQRFVSDWAEKRAGQEFHLLFPFDARQLCLWRGERFSLAELIHACVPAMASSGITEETLQKIFTDSQNAREPSFDQSEFKLLFVIDGLDQNLLELDFISRTNEPDVRKPTRVEKLLAHLVTRRLLPSARLWITTRPAAANQIPPESVDMVTELRGFTDPQKEDYFRRRFRDEEQARRIISHMKTSPSLHIMCHMPAFCWITAAVLQDVLETREAGELPSALTQMYAEFLVMQLNHTKTKYVPEKCLQCIRSLAKLAFQQLLRDNAVFSEEDVRSCGLKARAASMCSDWFPEIFKTFCGKTPDNCQKKVFCFTQSRIQMFLAALHVISSLLSRNKNVMAAGRWLLCLSRTSARKVQKTALRRALKDPNGKLDLFLRFIMGLSLQKNQVLLQDLLTPAESTSWSTWKTSRYIKRKISESTSPDRIIVMLHCLNELRDDSVVEEVQLALRSGRLSADKLSAAHWSTLVFILLSSEKHLDVFDLRKYSASEEVLLQLLPLLKASSKALLTGCKLSERSLEVLSLVLSSHSDLKELDLSENDLQDSGVKLLSVGLQSPNCKLERLRMSGCLITEIGCDFLVSALNNNPSHLKELDLSYNHPGDSGTKQLAARLEDPLWRLETLRLDHCGKLRLQPGFRKYACELELDSNTANTSLRLSKRRQKVASSDYQMYPDHIDRFDFWPQVLCKNALTDRCYWEVKWRGLVNIAVSYWGIDRKARSTESCFGQNNKSWTLNCFLSHFVVIHNKACKEISHPPCVGNRVGVYVDCPAGILSFYVVSSDTLVHLHTFNTTFTEPIYAGFGCNSDMGMNNILPFNSAVTVCPLLEDESETPAT